MMPTDLTAFSDMAAVEFPTLTAWVTHVQAHHAQLGDGGIALEPTISYAEFKAQEAALQRASAEA